MIAELENEIQGDKALLAQLMAEYHSLQQETKLLKAQVWNEDIKQRDHNVKLLTENKESLEDIETRTKQV